MEIENLSTTPESLHIYAREHAKNYDKMLLKKLIRWNEIVSVAVDFYPQDPRAGVRECLESCMPDRGIYNGKSTLADSLRKSYSWMLSKQLPQQ